MCTFSQIPRDKQYFKVTLLEMGLSTDGGTPKWLVYSGTWMIWGYPHFRFLGHLQISLNSQLRRMHLRDELRSFRSDHLRGANFTDKHPGCTISCQNMDIK